MDTAQHAALNWPLILQEVDADVEVAEEKRQKQLIENSLVAQSSATERCGTNIRLGVGV
jgi:hypothetical protein